VAGAGVHDDGLRFRHFIGDLDGRMRAHDRFRTKNPISKRPSTTVGLRPPLLASWHPALLASLRPVLLVSLCRSLPAGLLVGPHQGTSFFVATLMGPRTPGQPQHPDDYQSHAHARTLPDSPA